MSTAPRYTPEQVAALQASLNHGKASPGPAKGKVVSPPPPVPQARLKVADPCEVAGLNKTERSFFEFLKSMAYPWIETQAITLKLGHDCRYTPDFAVLSETGSFVLYEVKGFWRDDARVKIKVAARMFPMFRFIAVQRAKGGGWNFEEIKP
jgi:hypothetical protein